MIRVEPFPRNIRVLSLTRQRPHLLPLKTRTVLKKHHVRRWLSVLVSLGNKPRELIKVIVIKFDTLECEYV